MMQVEVACTQSRVTQFKKAMAVFAGIAPKQEISKAIYFHGVSSEFKDSYFKFTHSGRASKRC